VEAAMTCSRGLLSLWVADCRLSQSLAPSPTTSSMFKGWHIAGLHFAATICMPAMMHVLLHNSRFASLQPGNCSLSFKAKSDPRGTNIPCQSTLPDLSGMCCVA